MHFIVLLFSKLVLSRKAMHISLLYFITYVIIVLIFPPLLPSTQHPPFPQAIPTPLFMSVHDACNFFGTFFFLYCTLLHFLYCTLYHHHGYSVATNLYFLIPSPLHPFLHTCPHLATIKRLSISVILSLFFLFA